MANFVYVIVDETTREGIVVDSGWETDPILGAVADMGATVKFVVASHEHFDHTQTLSELAGRTGGKVVAHENSPLECDIRVTNGEEIRFGRSKVKVFHTPGHTHDSITLYDGKHAFTGDTLFIGTIGRMSLSTAESMYRSLYEIICRLPESTTIYPGHDYGDVPFRSLGEEKKSNPYLMAEDLRSFLSSFS